MDEFPTCPECGDGVYFEEGSPDGVCPTCDFEWVKTVEGELVSPLIALFREIVDR